LHDIVNQIVTHLQSGCHAVGFVSPTHRIPQVKAITESLWLNGFSPVIIYNTNAYDKVEELQALEKYVDVYLPDFKYSDDELAQKLSGIRNYSSIALTAIKEMYRQRGSTLIMDDGALRKGLIVRHLVLPGYTGNSINVLHSLADISTSIALSLMAQYQPTEKVKSDEKLGFNIQPSEYQKVCDEMDRLGFYKGWIQELESSSYYNPDFEKNEPFGNKTG
jgi:putative pyruvate formate lyase activating enzyme